MRATIIWGAVAGVGLLLLLGGIILGWVAGPKVVESMVKAKMDLTDPDSDGYKYFIEPPVPVMIKFTFFVVSNYQQVNDGTKIPRLVERGPYTYREDWIKKELQWSNESQYLRFGQYRTYTFVQENSCPDCKEDDTVRILNMPMVGLIAKAARLGGIQGFFIIDALEKFLVGGTDPDELFPETKVSDFLFNGISTGAVGFMINDESISDRLPPVFTPENGFALFNGKQNTSFSECYEVESSVESWDRHTMITKWGKDIDSLMEDLSGARTCNWKGTCETWWEAPDAEGQKGENSTCNQLKGTNGQQFPPFIKDQEKLWIFNTLPCRSIFLNYKENTKIEGISVREYEVPLDGANINKKINVCACEELSNLVNEEDSCVKEKDDETLDISNCTITSCYNGLQDITKCQGAPTYMSYPHFYLAPEQHAYFDGLSPDPEAHRTFLKVEPNTGMTLSLHSRVQLNIPLYSNEDLNSKFATAKKNMTILENIKTIPAFPVLWLDEGADVDQDPEMVKKLKKELVTPLAALNVSKWVLIGVGIAMAVGGMFVTLRKCMQ